VIQQVSEYVYSQVTAWATGNDFVGTLPARIPIQTIVGGDAQLVIYVAQLEISFNYRSQLVRRLCLQGYKSGDYNVIVR